jgi:hypothetical protein
MAFVAPDNGLHYAEKSYEVVGSNAGFGLSGSTYAGFQTVAAALADGDTCWYHASDGNGNWEIGLGTFDTDGASGSGDELERTTVYASSNAGNKTNFGTTPTGESTVVEGEIRVELVRGVRIGPDWTVTNHVESYALDCNAAVAGVGDNLGTLVRDLIRAGILGGTVAA